MAIESAYDEKMANVTLYTMNSCPFCERAKSLFKQKGISFKEILLEEDDDAAWDALYKKSGMKTMPQIFDGERLIGGYSQLAELDSKDGLASLK